MVIVESHGHVLQLPDEWPAGSPRYSGVFVAVLDDATPFRSNVVVSGTVADDADDLPGVAGAVLLSRNRSEGVVGVERRIYGYPVADAAVTALHVVTDPGPEGRLVLTFTADALLFESWLPRVDAVVATIGRAA